MMMEPVVSGRQLGEKGLLVAMSVVDMPIDVVPIRVLNHNKLKTCPSCWDYGCSCFTGAG